MTRLAWLTLGFATLGLGCGPSVDIAGNSDTDGDESSSTGGTTTDAPTTASTSPVTTSTPSTSTTDPTDPTIGPESTSSSGGLDSSTGGSTSFIGSTGSTGPGESSSSTGGSSTSGEPGLPDGEQCTSGDECASGECYVVGVLGGVCGECSDDSDCDFGCNAPNPLAMPPEGSTCGQGNLGENCENDDACDGLLECVEVLNVPGVIDLSSCSECDVDGDCMPGQVCNVDLDVADFSGVWTCENTGTVPLGGSCALAGSGDEACASTFCAAADIMGLIQLGICSECEVNGDCMPGEVCLEPEVGLDGTVVPGTCV